MIWIPKILFVAVVMYVAAVDIKTKTISDLSLMVGAIVCYPTLAIFGGG